MGRITDTKTFVRSAEFLLLQDPKDFDRPAFAMRTVGGTYLGISNGRLCCASEPQFVFRLFYDQHLQLPEADLLSNLVGNATARGDVRAAVPAEECAAEELTPQEE